MNPLVGRVRALGAEEHHADEYGPTVTVYGGNIDFPIEGRWGMTLHVKRGDREYAPMRATFEVFANPPQPVPGDRIPATRQTVLGDVAELSLIDTSFEPDPAMHQRTVADALGTGRPLVVTFATPAVRVTTGGTASAGSRGRCGRQSISMVCT